MHCTLYELYLPSDKVKSYYQTQEIFEELLYKNELK